MAVLAVFAREEVFHVGNREVHLVVAPVYQFRKADVEFRNIAFLAFQD
jgi:hypothetical protein